MTEQDDWITPTQPQSASQPADDWVTPGASQAASVPQGSSLLSRIGDGSRAGNAMQSLLKSATGQQSIPSGMLQVAGQGAGAVMDPVMDAAKSAWGDVPKKAADAIDSTGIGQTAGDLLMKGRDYASDLADKNPELFGDLGALANMAGAEGIGSAAKSAVESAGKASAANTAATAADIASKPKPTSLTSEDVRGLAKQAYANAEQQGGILSPDVTNAFISKASSVLPQTEAGKIVMGETPTTKLVSNLQNLAGKPMSLSEAQEIDSALGDKMTNEVDPATGRLNAEGNKMLQIQQHLRDAIENASDKDVTGGKAGFDSWDQGRQLWSAQMRMNDIERIMNRAQMMDNPVTGIKTGFRTLASNPSRLRGFTDDEIDAIKNAAKTGIVTGALRVMGGRFISGVAGASAGAVGGGILGAPVGLAAGEAAAYPLRQLANARQAARGNAVLDMIANRPAVQNALKPQEVPPAPKETPRLALPAPEPYSVSGKGVTTTPAQRGSGDITEINKGAKPYPLDYTPEPAPPAEPQVQNWENPLVPHMEGVVAELQNAANGQRYFDYSKDGQGGTPDVIGMKSQNPDWFQAYNKNNPTNMITKKYVLDTFNKMKSGAALGVKEQSVADMIRSEGISRLEQDLAQRREATENAKANPDDPNHEHAVINDDIPFAKGGAVKKPSSILTKFKKPVTNTKFLDKFKKYA